MDAPSTLRVSRTHYPVTALGPGTRLGIWVQGCPLACPGCMSLDTWNSRAGVRVDIVELLDRWRAAVGEGADGVTISGGEPLAQAGAVAELLAGIDRIRAAATARTGRRYDILLYTGYELSELDPVQRSAARLADVLVTGRFDAARPTELIWRGSANQRMVPQTDLGRQRYAEHVEHAPAHPPIQLRADPDGVWIIGTPRRGALPRLERALRRHGLDISAVSWRPPAG